MPLPHVTSFTPTKTVLTRVAGKPASANCARANRTSVHCDPLESRRFFDASTGAIYGQYYDNDNFTALSFTRNDPGIHFDWQNRAPLTRMSPTTFSARWMGQIRSTVAGTYVFNVDTDGAATLRVRGSMLTLVPSATGTGQTATVNLPANQVVDLQVDYSHGTGNARMNLDWTPPGAAAPVAVPTDRLVNSFAPAGSTFSNPIDSDGADPWVIQWHDEYIYVWSANNRIYGSRAARLQDIASAPSVVIYTPPANGERSQQVWAPELHRLDGKWYLYFAASDGNNANHRMFVGTRNADDPLGAFGSFAKLAPTTDRWAIDGTVLDYDGLRYFIWSGWEGTTDGQQNLYIARMSSPTTLSGDRVRISVPTNNWEKSGLPINEGPQIIQRAGETHVIFSASGYWTNEYALGDLKLTGSNVLSAGSWTKNNSPVFSQANGITGVGHASFVTSPDGKEDWIVYHAHKFASTFNEDRVVRTQPFTFDGGTPIFGAPLAADVIQIEPSGTATLISTPAAVGALSASVENDPNGVTASELLDATIEPARKTSPVASKTKAVVRDRPKIARILAKLSPILSRLKSPLVR